MAAFCRPNPRGARFDDGEVAACYAAIPLETAHAEIMQHRTAELEALGMFDAATRLLSSPSGG
jgi:hypothetical protein